MNSVKKGPLTLYGNKKELEAAIAALSNIALTGREEEDVEKILSVKKKIKASILYEGRTIYDVEVLVKEMKRFIDTNDISSMSNKMYQFLCDLDIAHYNKYGFISYYGESFERLYKECLEWNIQKGYHSYSVKKILSATKQYYESKQLVMIPANISMIIPRKKYVYEQCSLFDLVMQ